MTSVHNKLKDFRKWVNVDIQDEYTRYKVNELIDSDMEKDSPTILSQIKGKYSPYKHKLSALGKTQADLLNTEHEITKTFYVSLAAAKFKKALNKKYI